MELPIEIMGKITYAFKLPLKSVCVIVASRPFVPHFGKNGSLLGGYPPKTSNAKNENFDFTLNGFKGAPLARNTVCSTNSLLATTTQSFFEGLRSSYRFFHLWIKRVCSLH